MRHLLLHVLLLIAVATYAKPDYSQPQYWFEGTQRLQSSAINQHTVDVFYVLPTCVFAWEDDKGVRQYNADPLREDHRMAWQLSAELADSIFCSDANLFLPYYRQSTFGVPDAATSRRAGDMAKKDVLNAFKYYMKRLNNGRPFILAGFSQGARMVIELLRAMDDATYRQLVAAYVVGYGISASDTLLTDVPQRMKGRHKVQHIRLAQGADDTGVTICYNSVASPSAINEGLCGNTIACINPVSWTTSAAPATLLPAGGVPNADDGRFPYGTAVVAKDQQTSVTVSVDTVRHVLMVNGLDVPRYHLPALGDMFPLGNLHLQELFFYAPYLKENVNTRCRNYVK